MAEYCNKCAKKYGMESEEPCLCEGCGEYVDNNFLQKIFNFFKKNNR